MFFLQQGSGLPGIEQQVPSLRYEYTSPEYYSGDLSNEVSNCRWTISRLMGPHLSSATLPSESEEPASSESSSLESDFRGRRLSTETSESLSDKASSVEGVLVKLFAEDGGASGDGGCLNPQVVENKVEFGQHEGTTGKITANKVTTTSTATVIATSSGGSTSKNTSKPRTSISTSNITTPTRNGETSDSGHSETIGSGHSSPSRAGVQIKSGLGHKDATQRAPASVNEIFSIVSSNDKGD